MKKTLFPIFAFYICFCVSCYDAEKAKTNNASDLKTLSYQKVNELSERSIKYNANLITDSSVGKILLTDPIETVILLEGISNITEETFIAGEDTIRTTYLYQNLPNEFAIDWGSSNQKKQISSITLSYYSFARDTFSTSNYITTDSISVGTSVARLIEINKSPILIRFNQDGEPSDWNAGAGYLKNKDSRVESLEVKGIKYRIYFDERNKNIPAFSNQTISSDSPELLKYLDDLIVTEITINN